MAPVPDGAQLSEDQNYWWDGSQWQPVDGDASGGNGAEPHATGVDARFAENGDRFALMGEAIKRVAGDRLDAISRHLLQNAMKFATHEYGLIQTVQGSKKDESSLAADIAEGLQSTLFSLVPEFELAKAIAEQFLHFAVENLQGVAAAGVNAEAVRGELTRAVDALSQAFHDAADSIATTKRGVPDSVDQFLRAYVAMHPHVENLELDDATLGWFCDQIHIDDPLLADPSDGLWTAADQQMQLMYQRYVHAVQWADMQKLEKLAHLQEMPAGERRAYLQSVGEDPDEWTFSDGELNPMALM